MNSVAVLIVILAATSSGCSVGDDARISASCETTLLEADPILGPEARADSADDSEVWALFFTDSPLPAGEAVRLPADNEVKIVWRSTGVGDVMVDAEGPNGQRLDPDWGPEPHGSSTWNRPGDEWGTGWVFPATGCWTFRVRRDDVAATLVADVFDTS